MLHKFPLNLQKLAMHKNWNKLILGVVSSIYGNTVQIWFWYQPLKCTIHGREIQLFCYITNSRIVENENGSVTWSILVINSYDAIFSNILVLFARQLSFRLVSTGLTQNLLFHYSQEKMIFCICLSILIQIKANIVLNKCLHCLVRVSHDSGLFGTIFLFNE